MRTLVSLIVISIICLNTNVKAQAVFDLEKAKVEVEQRVREFEDAIRSGDLESLADLYTIDAQILNSSPTSTVGRAEIVKGFDEMIKAGWTESGFTTTGVWGCDEMIIEQGTGFFADKEKKNVSRGRYLMVWKYEEGKWRIFRDTWFSDGEKEE